MSAYALVLLVLVLLGWAFSYLVLWLGWRATPPALPLAVLGVATLGIVVFLVLGICVAAVAGTPRSTQGVCSMVFFPLLFLSGAIFPISAFPDALQAVAVWLPGYRLMEALLPLWTGDRSFDPGSVLYLVIALVVAVVLARRLLRRREDV
ncbi:ABC transporter permease [Actinomyces qiguomingii]|uniref:ABC transporter permease n=1 Tax=Actinomyces qiguomingii TaxID=2057800 RepID=UPI000CA02049|nr:ABC transporter permease [Actinomyces qiguomingii]